MSVLSQDIPHFGCYQVRGCVSQSEMFTSQVKKEEETDSSLTWALSHSGAASVHMSYFRTFSPPIDDSTSCVAFAWVLSSDTDYWKRKLHTSPLNHFNLSLNPVSLSPRFKGLIYYGSRNLTRERLWLCVHNVHVWLTSCLCTESKEQDVSRPAESKGRGSC